MNLTNKKEYTISNGLDITKENYFKIINKVKNEKVLVDKNFIYLNTGEKLEIEYNDDFTLVMRIIL